MSTGLQLGRPGVYTAPRTEDRGLHPVRLDVAGFVGVTLRGPVDTPVLLSSWTDYERRFGAFERPEDGPDRLLPYAVQAFFAQGGVRAYALRVAPPPDFDGPTGADATAGFAFGDDPARTWELAAADEGTWGNHLSIRLDFEVAQTFRATVEGSGGLTLPSGAEPADQSLVRIRRGDLAPTGELRWLTRSNDPATKDRAVLLDRALPDPPASAADRPLEVEVEVDVVTGTLVISDTSSAMRREERLTGLGLTRGHPRFVATVLSTESLLVRAVGPWDEPVVPDRFLAPRAMERIRHGTDRSYGIHDESFFDDGDAGDNPLDEPDNHRGADALGRVAELGILCVPDLTWRSGKPSPEPPLVLRARRRSHCERCAPR